MQVHGEPMMRRRELRVDGECLLSGLHATREGRKGRRRPPESTTGWRSRCTPPANCGSRAIACRRRSIAFFIRSSGVLARCGSRPDEELVGRHRRGRTLAETSLFVERHAGVERLGDVQRDVALRREDVHALAVVLLGPDHLPRAAPRSARRSRARACRLPAPSRRRRCRCRAP